MNNETPNVEIKQLSQEEAIQHLTQIVHNAHPCKLSVTEGAVQQEKMRVLL